MEADCVGNTVGAFSLCKETLKVIIFWLKREFNIDQEKYAAENTIKSKNGVGECG